MTTRRKLLILAGGALAAGGSTALTGCRERDRTAATVPDVLVADSRHGPVVLGGSRPRGLGTAAVVSPDGGLVHAVTRDADGAPVLERLDVATGVSTRGIVLGGGWTPRAVSCDGRMCALTRTPAAARPAARARTPLLVTDDGRQRQYDLDGVVEPDAFTADGAGLFVLEWLPPEAPDRYRVRLLDLASGAVQPLLTRDKAAVPPGAEEEMRGDGRQAVLSPDRRVLYTLYTHQPDHRHTRDLVAGRPGGVHAFVHVLHLVERWAYCLDLPHPFGAGPAAGHALAIGSDGRRLAVADVTSGSLAYAGTAALTIERTARVPAADGTASAVFAPDGRRVLIGAGTTVTVLDTAADAVTGRWSVPGAIRGLGLSRDGTRLYAGAADEVVRLDAGSGAETARVAVDGLTALRHVR